jgi:hypothetical protein
MGTDAVPQIMLLVQGTHKKPAGSLPLSGSFIDRRVAMAVQVVYILVVL